MEEDDQDWDEEQSGCCCCCCSQELGRRGWACLLGCLLATLLLLMGFSTDHWISVSVTAVNVLDVTTNQPLIVSQTYSGLWRECDVTLVNSTCEMIKVSDMGGWYQGVIGLSIVSLLSASLSLLAHCFHRLPVIAVLITITGLLTVVEGGLFAVEISHSQMQQVEQMKQAATKLTLRISTHFDWSFFVTLAAAGVYLLVGIAAGVLALHKKRLDNRSRDKEDDSDHDLNFLVPPPTWVPPRDFDAGFI